MTTLSPLDLLCSAIKEDAPDGDITCLAMAEFAPLLNEKTSGTIIAKQDLIFSGEDFINALSQLAKVAPLMANIEVELFFNDGQEVIRGQKIASLYGHYSDLLLIERSLLNIVGRLCGIATLTHKFVKKVSHTSCKILDTRKTTPLYRKYEKAAVVHGGGQNHRMNLSDAIMLKENHLQATPLGIHALINNIRKSQPSIKIILEVNDMAQVVEASKASVQHILLDNMTTEQLAESVKVIPANIQTEASGNMSLDRVAEVAETGVQFISVGQLTHSAPWADISFLLD